MGDQLVDDTDTVVGAIDRGTGVVEVGGSTLFTISGTGHATGHTNVVLGEFVKVSQRSCCCPNLTCVCLQMGYRELTQLALYVVFLDPCFAREDE